MRRIIIIGAGPGLGNSVAHLFGSKGFQVSIVGRDEERLKSQVDDLKNRQIEADYYISDVSDENDLSNALTELGVQQHIPDVILYNAFSPSAGNIEKESWKNIKDQLDVNVGGAFTILKTVLPIAKQADKGKLFFTGGGVSLYPYPEYIGLGIGKAALRNLIEAAAKEVEGTNVHISSVVVCGYIGGEDPKYHPDAVAEKYWELYEQEKADFETEIIY